MWVSNTNNTKKTEKKCIQGFKRSKLRIKLTNNIF